MPDSRADRMLAVGTFITLAAVVVMVATNWEAFAASSAVGSDTSQPPPVQQTAARQQLNQSEQSALRARVASEPRGSTAPAPPAARATLVITASRTASWLEVRSGDPTGEQVFFGMLEKGATSKFEQLPVWVTLGAAEGVEIRLAGSRISSFPVGENGVVQFIASEEGVVAVPAAGAR